MKKRTNKTSSDSQNIIGSLNEQSLHLSIKSWYLLPEDRSEVRIGRYIVDVVRPGVGGDLLIEIQTKNFSAIRAKLRKLVIDHNVRLVHPIAGLKWIVKISPSGGETISRRRSPKKGKLIDIFDELLRMPDLINDDNFTLEVLLIEVEEIRCDDGEGSWRRKGISIKDRRLINVVDRILFTKREDFVRFIPTDLDMPFSNKTFARHTGISVYQARRATYTLKHMGVIAEVGRNGNELLFNLAR